MLMGAQFQSVAHQLAAAAMPGTLDARRQATAQRYDTLLGHLLAPLAALMTQLREAPERSALVATAAFGESLRLAAQETLARLTPHVQEPPRPILRAQTLRCGRRS
jgi:hypothetical protein